MQIIPSLLRIVRRISYTPWSDHRNPTICGYQLRPGLGFMQRLGFDPLMVFSGGLPLPIGADAIVRHSQASIYQQAIKEWEVVRDGERVAVRYNPQGERDAFGNYPHYIFRIKNRETQAELLLGQNDIQSHGLLTQDEVKTAISEKNREIKDYRLRLGLIMKYSKFCNLSEAEEALVADAEKQVGDAQYPAVQALFLKVERVLQGRGYDFEKEIRYQELFGICMELDRVRFREFYFTEQEMRFLDALHVKWSNAEELLTVEEVQTLDRLYQKVYALQHALKSSAALWAHDQVGATYRFEDVLQAAAAWQANLYAANLYAERIRSSEIREVIDLGAGNSPLYQILGEMGILPQGRMIDVEHDETAYAKGKNPHRIRASITDLETIQEKTDQELEIQGSSFDLATSIFVYTHLDREQRKMAVAEGLRVLRKGGEMLIIMPESFIFSRDFLKGIIALGGEIISVVSPEPNRLDTDEEATCRRDFGPAVLRIVESLVAKRFQVLRIRKAKDITRAELAKVEAKQFYFMQQKTGRARGGEEREAASLSKDYLMALAYAAGERLKPKKIKVAVAESIPAEVIENQYKGFGEKYVELCCLAPILAQRDLRRLDRIAVACNQNRAVAKPEIEWMVGLHLRYWRAKINVTTFMRLFPEIATWRRSAGFSALSINQVGVQAIFDYPDEYRGTQFNMLSVLRLLKTSYAQAVGFKVEPLALEQTEEELRARALSVPQLVELLGCSRDAVYLSLQRDGDDRLSPYLLSLDGAAYLFNGQKVQEDLGLLKALFAGEAPQTGEITISDLADLIGCGTTAVRNALKRTRDHRLDPYLLKVVRVVQGQRMQVFNGAAVGRDLSKLQEAFGVGGERLPPQPGEITSGTLAQLIGIDITYVSRVLNTKGDERLTSYLVDGQRILDGKPVSVFDEAKVRRDLAKLKEAFGLGGERLSPQPGEITAAAVADLIGLHKTTVLKAAAKEGDGRLTPYLLGQIRVVQGADTQVFDEAKIRRDLEQLKEVFGRGGKNLPPQQGEITSRELAGLIGCSNSTLWEAVQREGDNRLTAYLLGHTRTGSTGHDVMVFDKAAVLRDLVALKRAFGKA